LFYSIEFIKLKFGDKETDIRNAISTKCNDEAKMAVRKLKRVVESEATSIADSTPKRVAID